MKTESIANASNSKASSIFTLFIRKVLKEHKPEIWQKLKNRITAFSVWLFLKNKNIRLHTLLTTLYWYRYVWQQKQMHKTVIYVISLTFPYMITTLFRCPINQKSQCQNWKKKLKAANLCFAGSYKRKSVCH